jgi:hypothetical protein
MRLTTYFLFSALDKKYMSYEIYSPPSYEIDSHLLHFPEINFHADS